MDATQHNEAWTGQGEPIAWRPTPEYLERSRLLKFMRQHGVDTYEQLCARANADPAWFWDATVKDLDLRWYQPYSKVMDTSDGIEWTRWFIDGQFNYVASALDKHIGQAGTGAMSPQPDHMALIWEGEEGHARRFTYAELAHLTNQAANALTQLGVQKGDRVGIFMPMVPETVAATLACGKIGAIFIPIFSGYGA
ncbi:MAG TPA: AMP-binding protein, partial [Ktedonobacterales bacterium]|nr:AMP-binding protein [Ktedonobacterales bacterium]